MSRDFLTVSDLSRAQLAALLDRADALRDARQRSGELAGRSVGLLFEKPSTRTRISFEVGVAELGGHPVVLDARTMQLGRGETVEDTARVLSRYLHALVVRTFAQDRLETLAREGTVPVINALSDHAHPCQALADLQTIRARAGRLGGLTLAYLGDGNNVTHSLMEAGAMMGMRVVAACPPGYEPDPAVVAADPREAVRGADAVYTDVWASMGQEDEQATRLAALRAYQVNAEIMAAASPDALVLHCLPAHRGEEITADVLDGPQSVVWDQAENRLHTQKALLIHLLAG
jgi:ornithine carbamoyltransferase